MALISCPECNNECSSMAKSCPKCGYPFAKKSSNTIRHETKTETKVVKIRCWGRSPESLNNKLKDYTSCGWKVISVFEDHWQGGILSPVYKVTLSRTLKIS